MNSAENARKQFLLELRDPKYWNGFYIDFSKEIFEKFIENDFIPDEIKCLDNDSMNFYFNSEDISSMDNLPKRTVWIQITNEETSITIEECGNYFTDKFDVENWQEMQSCLAQCLGCGWKGLNKDLVPNTKIGKLDNSDLNELLRSIREKSK